MFQHWLEHNSLGRLVPGRLGYVMDLPVFADDRHLLPYPHFDALAETFYESWATMQAAFQSREVSAATAQRKSFVDDAYYFYFSGTRHVRVSGNPPEGSVKLISFLHCSPVTAREGLWDVLSGPYRELIATALPIRHEQVIVEPDPRWTPGTTIKVSLNGVEECRAACDAVDMIWFRDPQDAFSFLGSELAYRAELLLGGRAFGTERVIARPIVLLSPPD
jgi:hypothetical protein